MAVVPVLLVLCGAIALCVIPVLSSGFNFEKNYSEGWNAYHAFRAASGEVLYSGDPRHFVNYPFLSFYLIAWLKPLFGDVLTIGRALSLIALAAISGGCAVVVRQLGGRPLHALFAAACVLGYQVVQAPGWIGSDDPQMLAEACMIGGLAWYLHDRTTIWRLAVTATLLGIGGFTKHNLIAILAAIMGGCPSGIAATPCGPYRTSDYLLFNGAISGVIGTSASAPAFAGVLALIEQYLGNRRLGNLNTAIYQIAAAQTPSSKTQPFHRTIGGFNGSFSANADGSLPYNMVIGNGSLDILQAMGAFNIPAAGNPGTPSNP